MSRTNNSEVNVRAIVGILIILNTTFIVLGIFLIVIGSALYVVIYSQFELFIESYYFKPVENLIAVGVLMVAISIVGCIGTKKKSTRIVSMYAFLLFLPIIVECFGAMMALSIRTRIFKDIEFNMIDSMKRYNTMDNHQESWDYMQERLRCCGVYGPDSWKSQSINGPEISFGSNFTVPESCCADSSCKTFYKLGCLSCLGEYASDNSNVIATFTIIALIVQIFGAIIACVLARALRRAKTAEEMKELQRQVIIEQLYCSHVKKFAYTPSSTEA